MKNLAVLSLLLAPSLSFAEISSMEIDMFSKHETCRTPTGKKVTVATPVCEPCDDTNSYVMIGGDYTRLNFKPSGERTLNGNLGGAHGRYEWRPENSFYAALDLKWRQGSMHGAGHRRTLVDLSAAERLGYNLEGDWGHCSLYTGFGFRFLSHHLRSTSGDNFEGSFFPPFLTTATALQINYYEFYIPVGFTSQYNVTSCFSLGINFEWMPQAFPTVQIRPLGGSFWSLTNKWDNFLAEVPLIFNLTRCGNWTLVVSPFYERWQDGHTTAKTSGGTPLGLHGNTYNFFGVDLNLGYAF